MADREKVIKGLEMHASGLCSVLTTNGKENCPYWENDDNCMVQLLKDALYLLKAQEPRVLTLEELTGDGECWFEGINGACGYADCYMCTGSKEVEVHRISMKPEYVSWDDFKKKWRCWSARPTDEQRESTPWEPPKEET